jgi:hypothetical protein
VKSRDFKINKQIKEKSQYIINWICELAAEFSFFFSLLKSSCSVQSLGCLSMAMCKCETVILKKLKRGF